MKTKLTLVSLAVFSLFFFSFAANAQESSVVNSTSTPESFPNLSVQISDFKLGSQKYQAGEKISGSFKLKNLTNYYSSGVYYEIQLHQNNQDSATADFFSLGNNTLYDFTRSEKFDVSPQEEKTINFSYQISKFIPQNDSYYLRLSVFSSRESLLNSSFQKISINNTPENTRFIFLDLSQAKVFGKDKIYSFGEGPTFNYDEEYEAAKDTATKPLFLQTQEQKISEPIKLKNQVKTEIFYRVLGGDIEKSKIKYSVYRYGVPEKTYQENIADWSVKFSQNSLGWTNIIRPVFKDPGSYETIIQFFDGEEKISNPLLLRYITSGDSGLVYNFLVEKKSDQNYEFNIVLTGPADYSGNFGQEIKEQIVLTAKNQKTGQVCYEETKDVNIKETAVLKVPITAKNCSEPLVFGVQLKKDGNLLDKQEVTATADNSPKESNAKKTTQLLKNPYAVAASLTLIAIIIIAIFVVWKKKKKITPVDTGNHSAGSSGIGSSGLMILLFLFSSFLVFSFPQKSLAAIGAPTLSSPADGAETLGNVDFTWVRPSGFSPADSFYELIVDGTSVSGPIASPNPPGSWLNESFSYQPQPGSHTWKVTASKGHLETICNGWWPTYCQEGTCFGGDCNSYNDVLKVDETVPSEPRTISGSGGTATHPGYPYLASDLSGFPGWVDGSGYAGWATVKFNGTSDSYPADASHHAYDYANYTLPANPSYDSGSGRFTLPENSTSLKFTWNQLPLMTCRNNGAIVYINFFVIDKSNNIVKRYSKPTYWYTAADGHYSSTVNMSLSLSGLSAGQEYALVVQEYHVAGGGGDPFAYARDYTYMPFLIGSSPHLTVVKAGTGTGTVTSTPAGINNCGATCAASFPLNTSVTLTASAASGSTFSYWGGACAGTTTCTVTMDMSKNVSAFFLPIPTCISSLQCGESEPSCSAEDCGGKTLNYIPYCYGNCPGTPCDKSCPITKTKNCNDPCPTDKNWKEVAP